MPRRVEQADIIVVGRVKSVEVRPSSADLQIDRTLKGDFRAPKKLKVRLKWAYIDRDSKGVEYIEGVKKDQYSIIILEPHKESYLAVPFNAANYMLPALPKTRQPKSGTPLDLVVNELAAVESAHTEASENIRSLLRYVRDSKP